MHEPDPAASSPRPPETPETPESPERTASPERAESPATPGTATTAGETGRARHLYPMVTGAAYAMLTLLGLLLGLYGGTQYGWLSVLPLHGAARTTATVIGALALAALLFVILRLAGIGMGTRMGALLPGTAWFLVTVMMSMPRPEGDLFITGSLAGYAYMFGGCAAVAVAALRTPSTSTWPFAPIPDAPTHDQRR